MLEQLLTYLSAHHAVHAKKIAANHAAAPAMRDDLARFLNTYTPFMRHEGIGYERLADAYLRMVEQMLASRIDFVRSGKYATELPEHANEQVYGDTGVMTDYMLGLALSQFLWKHHHHVFTFYRRQVQDLRRPVYALEVGSGHGLLLLELLTAQPGLRAVEVVDISETSLRLTASLLDVVAPDAATKVRLIKADVVIHKSLGHAYDFITIGEVLEHVANPGQVLSSLRNQLAPGGLMFMSTCANCPTIDHVYHFETVDEIRLMIADAGLVIRDEVVAPSEDVSDEDLRRHRLDVIYAAVLSR